MQLVLIADAYPPMKTSGAVQIRDLVATLIDQGHHVTVLLPDSRLNKAWQIDSADNLEVLRLKAPETKDVHYARRAVAEYLLSSSLYRNLKKSPLQDKQWDALIWYSPTIFFGKLVKRLKAESGCPAYLILRDIFPEWAVDMGLLDKGFIYRYFKSVERFQYEQADTIGVQTPSNLAYFNQHFPDLPGKVEVLNNWLSPATVGDCSIAIDATQLAGRTIFGYTGNIGIAQGMDILIDLAASWKEDSSIGFIFVGRGTAVEHLKRRVVNEDLDNVIIHDEIDPNEIPGLLAQCHVGLIALDPRHSNDNIPGKFLAYMQAGLPVLASINAGNDLEALVTEHRVGKVVTSNDADDLKQSAQLLLSELANDSDIQQRCRALAESQFSATAAVKQVTQALQRKSSA